MTQLQEEALEHERAAAAARMRDASERWEAQLQATRMRLMSEYDIKVRPALSIREGKGRGRY